MVVKKGSVEFRWGGEKEKRSLNTNLTIQKLAQELLLLLGGRRCVWYVSQLGKRLKHVQAFVI